MATVTVNLPTLSNWKTTLFGLLTAIGAALVQLQQTGVITWQAAVACSLWAIFCFLVPDAKTNRDGQVQIQALIDAVAGMQKAQPTIPIEVTAAIPPAVEAPVTPIP